MNKRVFARAGAFLVVGLGITSWSYVDRKPDDRAADFAADVTATSPSDDAAVRTLTAEVMHLRRELMAMRHEIQPQRESEQETPSPDARQEAPAPRVASAEESWRTRTAEVAHAFAEEPMDVRWANRMRAQVREAFEANTELRESLLSVECRSATCRVEMLRDNSPMFHQTFSVLMEQLGAHFTRTDAEPPTRDAHDAPLVLYFRSG